MEREWSGFKEKHFHWENRAYFAGVGQLVPAFFINLDLWQAAGLGDRDIPTTWEQLHAVAKRASRRGPDGKLAPAGLTANGPADLADWVGLMRYQKGIWRFSKDGKKSQADHAENLQSLEFLLRMWRDDIWPEKREIAAFERREAVIGFRFSQYANVLRLQQPDLRFKLIPVPTVTGQDLPARVTRGYDPAGPGIPSTTQGQKLEAAWLLVKQVWLNQEANAELCRQQSAVPCWAPVLDHNGVKESVELQTNSKVVPFSVFAGWTNLNSGVENPAALADVFAKSSPPRETLARVAEQETMGLSRNTNLIMERQYAHASRFKE